MAAGNENKLHKGHKRVISSSAPGGELVRADGSPYTANTGSSPRAAQYPLGAAYDDFNSPSRVRADQHHPTVVTASPSPSSPSMGSSTGSGTNNTKHKARKSSLSAIFGSGGNHSKTLPSGPPKSPNVGAADAASRYAGRAEPGSGAGAMYGYEDADTLHIRLKEEARERAARSAPSSPRSAGGDSSFRNRRTSGVPSSPTSARSPQQQAQQYNNNKTPSSPRSGSNSGWYTTSGSLPSGVSTAPKTTDSAQRDSRDGKYETLYRAAGLQPASSPSAFESSTPSQQIAAAHGKGAERGEDRQNVSAVPLPASVANAASTAQHRRRISRDEHLAQQQRDNAHLAGDGNAPQLPYPDMGKSPSRLGLDEPLKSFNASSSGGMPGAFPGAASRTTTNSSMLPSEMGDQLPASEIARQRAMLSSAQTTGQPSTTQVVRTQTAGPAQHFTTQGTPKVISTQKQRYLETPIPTISHPAPDHPMKNALFQNVAAPIPHYMFVSYTASVCQECVAGEQRMHAVRSGHKGETWKYFYKDPEEAQSIPSNDPNTSKTGRQEYQDTVSLTSGNGGPPCQCEECLKNRSIVKYAAENGLIEKIFEGRRHPLSEVIETTTYTTIIRAPIINETITTIWCEEPNCPECAIKQKEYEESEMRKMLEQFDGMIIHETGGSSRYEGYQNLFGLKDKLRALNLSSGEELQSQSREIETLLALAGNPRQERVRQDVALNSGQNFRANRTIDDDEMGQFRIVDGLVLPHEQEVDQQRQ